MTDRPVPLEDELRFVIREATAADEGDVLAWRNDPTARSMSGHEGLITRDDHALWYRAQLADAKCRMYVAVADDDSTLGMVRFDRRDGRTARVSINVSPVHRGRGLGRAFLRLGIGTYLATNGDVRALEAMIKNENRVSERLFSHLGFANRRDAELPGFFVLTFAVT